MFLVKDRVKQGTTTQGVGNVTLSSSFGGYQDFSVLGNGSQTFYTIEESTNWEVGIGTYNSNVLTRDTVIDSASGEGIPIYLSGSAIAFVSYPASGAVFTTGNIASVTGVSLGVSGVSFNDGSTQTTAATSFSSASGAQIDSNSGRISTIESTGVATAANLVSTGNILFTGLYNSSGMPAASGAKIDLNTSRVTTIMTTGVATAANLATTGALNAANIAYTSGLAGAFTHPSGAKIDLNTSRVTTIMTTGVATAANLATTGALNAANIAYTSGLAVTFTHPSGAKIDLNTSRVTTIMTTGVATAANLVSTGNILFTGLYNSSGMPAASAATITTIDTNLNAVMQSGEVMPGASGITLGIVDSNLKTVMTTGVATAANLIATGVKFQDGHSNVDLSIVTASGIVTPLISGNSTATTTLDLSLGSNFSYKLAVADTDFQVKNVAQGQKFTLRTEQDSTASRTITWAMGSEIRWAEGGTAPTGTEYPAGVADYYGFVAVETGLFMGFVIGSNIK